MNKSLRTLSAASLVIAIFVGVGIVVGALIFADDAPDVLDRFTEKGNVFQPMELKGEWLGMSLVDLTSATARRANIPQSVKGVVVDEISDMRGWRPRQAGVAPRDVLTSINGQRLRDIHEFYDMSLKVDVTDAITLDVNRWGQPMTLVIPAVYTPAAAAQSMAANGMPAQPAVVGAGQAAMPQPPLVRADLGANAQGAATVQQQGGPLWVCPRHGLGWQQSLVQPGFRCPLCSGQLRLAQ